MTDRQIEVLLRLRDYADEWTQTGQGHEWVKAKHVGGSNGSHHTNTLEQLFVAGYADQDRRIAGSRVKCYYRITEGGRVALRTENRGKPINKTTLKDLVGMTFGMLEVLRRAPNNHRGGVMWECKCDCGNFRVVAAHELVRKGGVTHCGCSERAKRAAANKTHGMSRTSLYWIWRHMVSRCHNPEDSSYRNYGARGIRVCDLWRWSCEEFTRDMGERPQGMSIERIDNNYDYCPMNCRWATTKEQLRNTRRNRWLTFDGKTMTLADWTILTGMNKFTLRDRLEAGWTIEEALTTPVGQPRRSHSA